MSKSNSIEPKKKRKLSWIIEIIIVLVVLVLMSSSSDLLGKIIERDQREQLLLLPLFTVLLLAIPAVGLGAYLFLVRRRVQDIEKTEVDAAQLMDQLLPGLSGSPPPPTKTSPYQPILTLLLLVGLMAGMLTNMSIITAAAGVILGEEVLRVVALILAYVPIIAGLVVVTTWSMAAQFVNQVWAHETPLFSRQLRVLAERMVVETIKYVILVAIFAAILIALNRVIDNLVVSFVVALVLWVQLFGRLVLIRVLLKMHRVMQPLRRLDYDLALERARRLDGMMAAMKVDVLVERDCPEEAESALREIVEAAWTKPLSRQKYAVIYLGSLGFVRLAQGRYADAAAAYEGLFQLMPEDDIPISLAETYLRQGIQAEKAVELTHYSLQRKQRYFLRRFGMWYSIPEAMATQAWALAAAGHYDESRRVLEQALARSRRHPPHTVASTHLRAGYTLRLCGTEPAARDHFAQAAQITPMGRIGHLAQRALAEPGAVVRAFMQEGNS